MTDVSSAKAHADPLPASLAPFAGPTPPVVQNGSPAPADGAAEEADSSTIKCICGFSDDDGATVLCEKCDTWQHIVCYYESNAHVPDVHECTDCLPRQVDSKSAADKQRLHREQLLNSIGDRKGRPKTTAKNPKKRPKDTPGPGQPNGWPVTDLHYNPERKSGSPRDPLPPNKRPKTNHRSSNSMSVVSQAPALIPGSRKRGASVMVNGHSPVKSPTNPDGPIEDYSAEFMNLYRQSEPPSAENSSFTNLDVANDIAMWLRDPDVLAEATGGKKPQDLFSRIDMTIQDLELSTAPEIVKQTEVDSGITAHGLHPQWHFITAETPVADGGYIGELKGLIGRKADYFTDHSNRWELLRHPEPFVFFPPYLPIYIDTRRHGNNLRYARRSCCPNMSMKILIESSNDYHFCFLATREIHPGEELTVGWDIDSEVQRQLAKVVTNGAKEGFRKIQPWVSCVLANFGGCACDTSTGYECLLERARRNTMAEPNTTKTKGRKTKKSQLSPLSTGRATNSRAGSETLNRDLADDDQMDMQSTSGSHKSSSRDITPATHFSLDGDLKMSDREKRKLQQQERLFEQLEFDEQHKGRKGKRNSAGSTLNTPSLSSSRRLGHPDPSPSARHREHSHGVARKTSGSSTKTNGRTAPKPKPVYKEASTQTDECEQLAQNCVKPQEMRPPLSFKRKLLQQAQEDILQRERLRSTSVKMEVRSPALKDVSSSKPSPLPPSPPLDEPSAMDLTSDPVAETRHRELTPAKELTPTPTIDVEMGEAEDATAQQPSEPKVEELPDAPALEVSTEPSHPQTQPPAPPWPSTTSAELSPTATCPPPKSELHVETLAKPELNNSINHRDVTPGVVSTVLNDSSMTQSPSKTTIASPLSPVVTNAVKPTPTRKKLSLSDYTNRRAKLAQTQSTCSTASPSVAPSNANSSPTLSAASLPNGSPPPKAGSPALPTVKEEPMSLDAGTTTTTAAILSASTST